MDSFIVDQNLMATKIATPGFHTVPLDWIAPSATAIQAMRRKRFDPERLKELAESIRALGLQQPIVLRPHPAPEGNVRFEIVAGERRWLASQIAETQNIDAKVSPLTDEQVLEIQLIENLQREGLHELEEAEGYEALMKLKGISADQVGETIGKSRSYVFARLKLLALCPEARKAFYEGKISASVALLIARIGNHTTQADALTNVSEGRLNHGPMSYREARDYIQRNYMLELKDAPFDIKCTYFGEGKQKLTPIGTPCAICPKRTGNQVDLFNDVKNADVCTDPICWAAKRKAHTVLRIADARAQGRPVIEGKEAQRLQPYAHTDPKGLAPVDSNNILTDWKTPRKVLGKDLPPTAIFINPHTGDAIEVVPEKDLVAALKKKGITVERTTTRNDDQRKADQAAKLLTATRTRILQRIREANRTRELDDQDAWLVQSWMVHSLGFDSRKRLVDQLMAEAGQPKPKGTDYVNDWIDTDFARMDAPTRARLMIDIALVGQCHSYGDAEELTATAQRLGLDPKAIEAEVKAEFKAREKAKGKPAKKAGKKAEADGEGGEG